MSKVITVYINGTDEPSDFATYYPGTGLRRFNFTTSLANVLNELTVKDQNNISICLDGCGINNPYYIDLGGIFSWNLEAQINELVDDIKERLGNEKITLNLYGFSRGGAGVYLLAKKLKDIDPEQLEINILAFEPVPGNFVYGVYVDKFLGLNRTLSSMISDLSDCRNLNRVQSLYTNEPLPDITCHAPILPAFHATCEHTVDVVPGCHKNAESFTVRYDARNKYFITPYNVQSAIAFRLVRTFLQECGTIFDDTKFELYSQLQESTPLKTLYNSYSESNRLLRTTRHMHFSNSITTSSGKSFLNKDDQTRDTGNFEASNCSLSVKDPAPTPSYWNGQKSAARVVYTTLLFAAGLYAISRTTGFNEVTKRLPRLRSNI